MAQACFEAAAKTLTTLEKRGLKMCPILVKLAEINFLLFDFKSAEVMVDTLIQRAMPEQTSLLFAYLMKSYFSRLKNETILAQEFLKRAHLLQPDAKVEELQVVKTVQNQRKQIDREPIMLSPTSRKYVSLTDEPGYKNYLTLKIKEEEDLSSFPKLFTHFIRNFCTSLESNNEQSRKLIVLDCAAYLETLRKHKRKMIEIWACSFTENQALHAVTEKLQLSEE